MSKMIYLLSMPGGSEWLLVLLALGIIGYPIWDVFIRRATNMEEWVGTGLIIWSFILALVGGFMGIILGLGIINKTQSFNGKSEYKYDEKSRSWGYAILLLSIASFVFQIIKASQ